MVGIYHLTLDGKIVYIGQSIDIEKRVNQHFREELKLFNNWKQYEYKLEDLDRVEKEQIKKYNPFFNKSFSASKATNTNIALYYGLDRKTIGNYKNSTKEEDKRKYEALKEYFIKMKIRDKK